MPGVPSPKATTDVNGNFSLTVWDVPRDMAVVITKNDGRQPTTFPGVTFNPGGRAAARLRHRRAEGQHRRRGARPGQHRGADRPTARRGDDHAHRRRRAGWYDDELGDRHVLRSPTSAPARTTTTG